MLWLGFDMLAVLKIVAVAVLCYRRGPANSMPFPVVVPIFVAINIRVGRPVGSMKFTVSTPNYTLVCNFNTIPARYHCVVFNVLTIQQLCVTGACNKQRRFRRRNDYNQLRRQRVHVCTHRCTCAPQIQKYPAFTFQSHRRRRASPPAAPRRARWRRKCLLPSASAPKCHCGKVRVGLGGTRAASRGRALPR